MHCKLYFNLIDDLCIYIYIYERDICAILSTKNTKHINNFKRYLNVQGIIQSLPPSETANSLTKVRIFYIIL